MIEEWAWSAMAPGYLVSSAGNIRKGWDNKLNRPGRIKAKRVNEHGYETVSLLPFRQKQNVFYVHRLVADAFHGSPPPGKPQARHLDGNRTHNTPDNLKWGSAVENEADKARHGTRLRGEEMPAALLTDTDVAQIRREYSKGRVTQIALAKKYGVARSTVRNVVNNYSWRHVK